MTKILKPNHCDQNWLEMTPTNGGRICEKCNKRIVDFSKMNWAQIERIQNQNNNAVCGMYNHKQLENWGHELPTFSNSIKKAASITGLTVFMALPSNAQTTKQAESIVIKGQIFDEKNNDVIIGAQIILKKNNMVSTSDFDGNFQILVPNISSALVSDTLVVTYNGYLTKQIILNDIKDVHVSDAKIRKNHGGLKIFLSLDQELQQNLDEVTIIKYAVRKPTLKQRIHFKIKKWFGKKEQ